MCDENEDWEDCEETTVLVEIHGIIKPDFLQNVEKAKVLGIDTDTPYLQLDDNTFRGSYHDCLGTCLLFKDKTDYNTDVLEEGQEIQPELEYYGKTCKKLYMQRVFIKGSSNSENRSSQEVTLAETENQNTSGPSSYGYMVEDKTEDTLSKEQDNGGLGNKDQRITNSSSIDSPDTVMEDT